MSERTDSVRWIPFRCKQLSTCFHEFWANAISNAIADCVLSTYSHIYRCTFLRSFKLGSMTYIAEGTRAGFTDVGTFCSVGNHVSLGGLGWHPNDHLSIYPAFYSTRLQAGATFVKANNEIDNEKELQDTKVGNDVWIGAGWVVPDGIKIGDETIIAAEAVVTIDVPAHAIVGSVLVKVIRYRFDINTITTLLKWCWWQLSHNEIQAMATQFMDKTQWCSEDFDALNNNTHQLNDFVVAKKRVAAMA